MELLWVHPGTFTMGSPLTEADRGSDENQTQVNITKGYFLGKFEVTQDQYETVMTGNDAGYNASPSSSSKPNGLVTDVSNIHATKFMTYSIIQLHM